MENYFADCMTQEELRQKYRELCVRMHPDRNQENPNATAEFQEMQQQYEERKAELNGDYTKARKGRERREREAREREERERKERERRRVEQVILQARNNLTKNHADYQAGDYVYAHLLNFTRSMFDWDYLSVDDMLHIVHNEGVKEECVVKIETIVGMSDGELMEYVLSNHIPEGIWGGWEVIQKADPAQGIGKSKRVAKVVMFRSKSYCVFGNPQGDRVMSDYYLPAGYKRMFCHQLVDVLAQIQREEDEKRRIEAERKAKLLAEQQPLIDEWKDRLVEVSRMLSVSERETVAVANLNAVLKGRFPGTTFRMRKDRYGRSLSWEDGPTIPEVDEVIDLFCPRSLSGELTPWMERYGTLGFVGIERKMSVLTKAKILQQLGQVTEAFRECGIDDEVELTEFDWLMLHAMVGVDVSDLNVSKCMNTLHADGRRTVRAMSAVLYIFKHTSYKKNLKIKKLKH